MKRGCIAVVRPPTVSIVIPAFNEAAELPATLAAARASLLEMPCRGEIIVVDNASTDETVEVARQNGADQVVAEPVKQIARARNRGAAAAHGRFLVFVDADTRIDAGLLGRSLDRLHRGDAGGGAVIEFEGDITRVGHFAINLWKWISRCTNTAAGSYIFCRRTGFFAVGGFDERLYAGEEIRFSRRLKAWGRARGRRFSIIDSHPARTSPRKLDWYSGIGILGWMLFLMIFPLAVRWRQLCGFWYRRPMGD